MKSAIFTVNARAKRGLQATGIAAALRAEIIGGELKQGEELRQERIAAHFGVSRMPVREALRLLEAEGLVSLHPNRSARVATLSALDLAEICEMRIAAETAAIRHALPQLSNAQIGKAEDIQERLEQAPIEDFGRLNAAFHRELYRPCARPRLLAHIETLSNAADRYLRITIATLEYAEKSHREHHELLTACANRDEAAAVSCLTKHIHDAGEALAALMP